ncbi:alkaline phosphatase family protein [Salinibacterium soli]|uniref:Alkaline phosphatase family protein n=1 Tax=Antiquaquibacter soli TaxID=3064523 RepID=A0ABT9BM27_9MICO|nr:alkaline phosphatase family protein [Protaetiibacter sp. WY-16]MDO7882081.1 alkaline phosphatase family protein [Protaetiibacter sp. WY-16]
MLGEGGRLALPSVDRAVVVLVDGLGVEALRARSGHARRLAAALGPKDAIAAGFPTTTASAITTLTTGRLPGAHGIVGYSVADPDRDAVVNQLTGWDERQDPATWQRERTLFERASADGLDAVVIGPERYRDSGFSRAALRGARYLAGSSVDDRVDAAIAWLRSGARGIAYLYIPELDVAAHAKGWESGEWTAALEGVDGALGRLATACGPRDGMLVTADHGVLDVPAHAHVLVDEHPGLLDGVRHVAGEPRCLQLRFEPDADPDAVVARWKDAESDRAWIATRDEVVESGWFGAVDPVVARRMGDLFVAARKAVAYYDGRTAGASRRMVGQHGSASPTELRVPLLRFGGFER